MLKEDPMRSELVSGAVANIPNRYLLACIASRASRPLHRPNTRMEETLNQVFRLVHRKTIVVPDTVNSNPEGN